MIQCRPLLVTSKSGGPSHFSQLLQASGVYKEGDKAPATKVSTPTKAQPAVFPQAEADSALQKEVSALAALEKDAERTSSRPQAEEAKEREEPSFGFMPRNLPSSPGYPTIPYPSPSLLGFPGIESFFTNYRKTVQWQDAAGRKKRNAEPSRLGHGHVLPPPHDLPPVQELPLFPPLGSNLHIDHTGHISQASPHVPGPIHHQPLHLATPAPHGGHHVTISTPTHHISHGVLDHGSHHAVHKEHHQVHGQVDHHGHTTHLEPLHHVAPHPAPILIEPKGHLGHHTPHHPQPIHGGYPKPAHGGSLEEIFGIGSGYSPAPHPHTPAPYHPTPEPYHHTPAYHPTPEPYHHTPEPYHPTPEPYHPTPEPYHPPVYSPDYSHPSGDYVSPKAKMIGHPFSMEHVFKLSMPHYYMEKYPHMAHMMHHEHHDPHHGHHALHKDPHHEHHDPHHGHHDPHHAHHDPHHDVHHAPVLLDSYKEPAPVYHPPKVYDHKTSGYPKPKHGASLEEIFGVHTRYAPAVVKPVYHAPEPHSMMSLHPPALKYAEPKPEYHSPKPEYHAPKPDYHAPKPEYHPPKPEYHAPKPEYHPPKPEYHSLKPEYHAPKPEYHAPKPEYHAPKPEYHAPKPEYHPPKPEYHPPKPEYHPPHHDGHGYPPPHNGGSLEAIFGLGHHGHHEHPHHVPDYHPTTYKPKMPDYVNKEYKSLPQDPGYVLHYLPYEDYEPVHPESVAHPPPVPHHPGAAHILVPGTHPLPAQVRSLGPLRGARVKRSPVDTGQSITPASHNIILDTDIHTNRIASDSDYNDFSMFTLLDAINKKGGRKNCLRQNSGKNSMKGCLNIKSNLLSPLPQYNFSSSDGKRLSQKGQTARTTAAPFLYTQPGSLPTTPSWRFPSQGTTNGSTPAWLGASTTPATNVYFNQPRLTTPAPTGASGQYEILTNPLFNISSNTSISSRSGSFIAPKLKPSFADILAMMKDDLMRQIKAKEGELERERLMQEIKLKETELQGLLQGTARSPLKNDKARIASERVDVDPSAGIWRIQSQVLGGKEIPEGEWILPGTQLIRDNAFHSYSLYKKITGRVCVDCRVNAGWSSWIQDLQDKCIIVFLVN